jgi:hypothetical protein
MKSAIKVFKVDPMTFTPFCSERFTVYLKELYSSEINRSYFNSRGIYFIKNELEADVFISRYLNKLIDFMRLFPDKKFLIWTHEPRDSTFFTNKVSYSGKLNLIKSFLLGHRLSQVHIMNAYTGDIYLNNYNRYGCVIDRKLEYINKTTFPDFKHRKVAALMLYRNNKKKFSLRRGDLEIDREHPTCAISINA